jgi:hypothetical protein
MVGFIMITIGRQLRTDYSIFKAIRSFDSAPWDIASQDAFCLSTANTKSVVGSSNHLDHLPATCPNANAAFC